MKSAVLFPFILLLFISCKVSKRNNSIVNCKKLSIDSTEVEFDYFEFKDSRIIKILDSCITEFETRFLDCKTCSPSFITLHLYVSNGKWYIKLKATSNYVINFNEAGYENLFNIYPTLGIARHKGYLVKLSGPIPVFSSLKILRTSKEKKKEAIYTATKNDIPFISINCDYIQYYVIDSTDFIRHNE